MKSIKYPCFYKLSYTYFLFLVTIGISTEKVFAQLPNPRTNDFSKINAYFDRAFYSPESFVDSAYTVYSSNGDQVFGFKEMKEKKGRLLQYTNQPTFVFPVPSAPHGDRPKYSPLDGGYVHIFNGFNKTYSVENMGEKDLAPFMELVYVCRKYPSTAQEQFHAGFGWPKYKFDNSGNAIVGISDFTSPYSNKKGNFNDLEVVVINEVYYGAPNHFAEILISDSRGDLISQGRFVNPTNGFPNYIRNAGIGSNGHPINHDFFGMWYTLGRVLTPDDRCDLINELKKLYPIGKLPSRPYCLPTITWNSTNKTFDVTINYNPGYGIAAGGDNDIDLDKTVVNWYYGNAKVSTGNPLDDQDLIATTSGKVLSLKRADYSTKFPNPPSRNIVNVGITVFNKKGESWTEICAFPFLDEFN
ncbi:MAG: hypothetical protein U0V72_04195 [Cytophagales bacterium]